MVLFISIDVLFKVPTMTSIESYFLYNASVLHNNTSSNFIRFLVRK